LRVSDDAGTILSVTYVGSKPDMFKEGQGVVVEGRMGADGVFNATTLMVKHNESYKAAEEAHDKGDYTKTLIN
jgi:cytochrome c-type biogenesis protein CcmE